MSHATTEMQILRNLIFIFFSIYPLNTFNSIIPFPFLIMLTILSSQGRFLKSIQVSNPIHYAHVVEECIQGFYFCYLFFLFRLISNRILIIFQHNCHHQKQFCPFYISVFHHVLNHDYIYQLVYLIGKNKRNKGLLHQYYEFRDHIRSN